MRAQLVYLTISWSSSFLSCSFLCPGQGWREGKRWWGNPDVLPLDIQARTASPEAPSYIFFQRGTKTHSAFLPLLRSERWGFRKTNRPLKILGARGLAWAFPALLPVCAWAIEERGNERAWVYGGFLRDIIKSPLPAAGPHRAEWRLWVSPCSTSLTVDWTPRRGVWRQRGARCFSSLLVGVSRKLYSQHIYIFIVCLYF